MAPDKITLRYLLKPSIYQCFTIRFKAFVYRLPMLNSMVTSVELSRQQTIINYSQIEHSKNLLQYSHIILLFHYHSNVYVYAYVTA